MEADGGAAAPAPAPDPVAPADPVVPDAPATALPPAPVAPVGPGEDVAPVPGVESPEFTGELDFVILTVVVNNKMVVAAQPVHLEGADLTSSPSTQTIADVLKAAHDEYYEGGAAAGFVAGIDKTWNMYLVTKCWGVDGTPYIIRNKATLAAAADAEFVGLGDNIIVSIASDPDVPARAVSMTSIDNGNGTATVTATEWIMDFATFTYTSSPLSGGNLVDPKTGKSLAITDSAGTATVTIPDSKIVAVADLSAIRVDVKPGAVTLDYSVFMKGDTLLPICIFGLIVAIPLGVIVFRAQRKELKNRGVKFAAAKFAKK
jgi:hypothetical protein